MAKYAYVEAGERDARVARLESVAREIAAGLGNEWTARTMVDGDGEKWAGFMRLVHISDSREINLTVRLYESPAKIEVSGDYVTGPEYLGLSRHMNNERPTISVSLDRPGAAIAKDIQRRFMPEYTRVFTDILAVVIANQERWDTRAAACDRLAALTKDGKCNGPHEWRGAVDGRVWGRHDGTGVSIDLKVDNLSEAQAAEVIALVNSFKIAK
jgi:hypothetical protein